MGSNRGTQVIPVTHRLIASIAGMMAICLCGCPFGIPLGTPRDHYRPHGHQDTTLDVSPTEEVIVFNARGTGGRDLYLLRLDNLQVTRVAETPLYETWPSFSADGQMLVYSGGVPGDRADHIFRRPVAGGDSQQLTNDDANDSSPRFSPDGSWIVFARDKTYQWGGLAANWEPGGVICLMRSDGMKMRQLTSDDAFAFEPRFSADGTTVIFSTLTGMASVPIDGSTPPKTIPGPPGAVSSADSKLLAYCKGKYEPDLKLYVANVDDTAERVITVKSGGCYRPIFSRQGDRLFYLRSGWPSGPSGSPKSSIWTVTLDGSSDQPLTDDLLFDDPLGSKPRGSQ